jgi:hypothetical protein
LVKQDLAENRLAARGEPALWYRDAALGVLYRRGTFVGTNALPQPTITAPVANARFAVGAPIEIVATANDPDGTIARIEFYNGADKLGEDTTAPYGLAWTSAPQGNHRLIVRAVDNLGGSADSVPVPVTVGNPGGGGQTDRPQLAIRPRPDGAMRLTINAPAGDYIIEQSPDLKSWADIYPVTVSAGGSAFVDDPGGPMNLRTLFYRARRN